MLGKVRGSSENQWDVKKMGFENGPEHVGPLSTRVPPVLRQIGREGGCCANLTPGVTQPLNMAEFRNHRCLASCDTEEVSYLELSLVNCKPRGSQDVF